MLSLLYESEVLQHAESINARWDLSPQGSKELLAFFVTFTLPRDLSKPARAVRTRWLSCMLCVRWLLPKIDVISAVIEKNFLKGADGKIGHRWKTALFMLGAHAGALADGVDVFEDVFGFDGAIRAALPLCGGDMSAALEVATLLEAGKGRKHAQKFIRKYPEAPDCIPWDLLPQRRP